jgi:hypothetical protein
VQLSFGWAAGGRGSPLHCAARRQSLAPPHSPWGSLQLPHPSAPVPAWLSSAEAPTVSAAVSPCAVCASRPSASTTKAVACRPPHQHSRAGTWKVSSPPGAFVRDKRSNPSPPSRPGCRYLIERANVALVPGDAFGAPACLRISYAASLETLGKALDRLEQALAPSKFTRRQ